MTDDGWTALVDGMRAAGESLDAATAALDAAERADGRRALLRAVNNLLGRLEVDRDRPELMPFNGWREKFFMDNPDYRYWITDIRDDRSYRITGNIGQSVYQSITVYSGKGVGDAAAVARIDSDDLGVDADGDFGVTLATNDFGAAPGLTLPSGSTSLWVRYAHHGADPERPGWCRIETLDPPPAPAAVRTRTLDAGLSRIGAVIANVPQVFELSVAADAKEPNTVRRWSAMAGGAAFTEPGIDYLRGAWQLDEGEALLIEGVPPPCRHWNIVLYSRFLNSLDYGHRTVSRTGASSTLTDGRYRFVLAARDPGVRGYDWLDTEGRRFGLFVLRFLQPGAAPDLPQAQRIRLGDLEVLR